MDSVNISSISTSYDGTCGPEKRTKCATGCCSQYGNCGTSPDFCSGGCQHAFGTGCTDADVAGSWQRAAQNGITDQKAGGQYYFDAQSRLFWTWDTPELISRKFEDIVKEYNLGGVMAWSLGEDSADWRHLRRMAEEVAELQSTSTGRTSTTSSRILAASTTMRNTPQERSTGYSLPPSEPTHFQGQQTAAQSSAAPYSVVWVDGTQNGPMGDYATEPGSPPDYTVAYNAKEPVDLLPDDDDTVSTITLTETSTMAFAAEQETPIQTIQALTPEPISSTLPQTQWSPPSPPPPLFVTVSTSMEITSLAPPPPYSSLNSPFDVDSFTPDPGYVNPNWPLHDSPAHMAIGQLLGAASSSQSVEPAASKSSENATAQPQPAPYSSRPMQPVDAPVGEESASSSSSSFSSPVTVLDAQATAVYTGGSCRLRWRKKVPNV